MDREKQLITLLKNCWDQLNLEGIEDLFVYKLDRIEDPHWESPFLNFDIERHGGIAMGSTRAEIQSWRIDLDNLEISCYESGYRQKITRQAIVNVKPIAEELIPYIVNKSQHKWLQWSAKGRLRVLTGDIFPDHSAPKQTVIGRRKRLILSLEKQLTSLGWSRNGSWWDYARARLMEPPK